MRVVAGIAILLALTSNIAPLHSAAAAPAEVVREFLQFGEINACTNELVTLEGTLHVVTKTNRDGTFTQHLHLHGTGTGAEGNEYVYNDRTVFTTDGVDFEVTFETLLISKGPEQNERFVFYNNTATGESSGEFICTGGPG